MVCLCAGAGLASPTARPPARASVGLIGVRFGSDLATTRVVLDLDAAVAGKLMADDPAVGRIVISLPVLLSAQPLQGRGQGLVRAWAVVDD